MMNKKSEKVVDPLSNEQAQKFLNRVERDEKVFSLLKSLPDSEAQYALASQLGFQFTREELAYALRETLRQRIKHQIASKR